MATATGGPQAQNRPSQETLDTKVSAYDRVSGILVALTVMTGFFATMLFLVWLTSILKFPPTPTVVMPINDLKGRGEAAEGYARDIEEPGVEELPDVQEPQLSETLEAVTDAVSNVAATREAFAGDAAQLGKGSGQGDSRGAGPGGEGDLDVIPPWERWNIQYSTTSLQEYAKQLDFFKIELASVDRATPRVEYATNLSNASPTKRLGVREDEKRIRFTPLTPELLAMDRQLLAKAQIPFQNRIVAQFYPDGTLGQLLQKEAAALGSGRTVADVRVTVFGVRPAGAGYEYHVIRQEFLR